MSDFFSRWKLVATASAETKIPFVEPSFDAEFAQLSDSASDLRSDAVTTSGLTLEISVENGFKQTLTGKPKISWYHHTEGTLERKVTPFDGACVPHQNRLYIIPDDLPKRAIPKDAAKRDFFRYDDGDTIICDFVEILGNHLCRTVNAITDGKYKTHTLMLFERTSE